MPQQLWIADYLRAYGCTVHEVDGWKTRGLRYLDGPNKGQLEPFTPKGVVGHHTASKAGRPVPSLGICIDGRTGTSPLRGPLCEVLIGREPKCYVVAAGKANHAGSGGWKGLSGNGSVLGIEVENDGLGEPWSEALYREFVLCAAALLDGIGAGTDMFMGHKEWTPRKPDPKGIDMNRMRADVESARRNKRGRPMPDPFTSDLQGTLNTWLPDGRKVPVTGTMDHATVNALKGLLNELGLEANHQRTAMALVNGELLPPDRVPIPGRRWTDIDTEALRKALATLRARADRADTAAAAARDQANLCAADLAVLAEENATLRQRLADGGGCDPDVEAASDAWWRMIDLIKTVGASVRA